MEQFFVQIFTREHVSTALVVGLVVLCLTAIVLHLQAEEKLSEDWAALAAKLDMRQLAKPRLARRFPSFKSFSVGYDRHGTLLESAAGDVLLGTYGFRTSKHPVVGLVSTSESIHDFSLCVLKTPGLALPRCLLRPEGLADKLLGGQDFDFPDDPEFSKGFVLQGDDEEDVRARFDRRTREWLVAHRSRVLGIEAYRDTLAFFAPPGGPAQMEQLLGEARELLSLWK